MAKPKKKYTEPVSLPMLPLRGLMVFPHMVLHFDAGRKKSIAALDQAMEENQRIFLVAQRDMDVDDPAVDDIYHVGTIACVKQVLRLPGGNVRLLVEGKSRAVLRAVTQEEPYFVGALDEVLEQGTPVSIETDALLRTAHHYFEEYCKMSGRISGETMQSVLEIEDPKTDKRIDFVGGIRGLAELERRVHTDMKVAFSMYPTSIGELFAVADAGRLMPPKSTWFEPKLRSGLFLHEIER